MENETKQPDQAENDARDPGEKLFHDQAVTINKSGDHVSIQCDSAEDAEKVFEWLCEVAAND